MPRSRGRPPEQVTLASSGPLQGIQETFSGVYHHKKHHDVLLCTFPFDHHEEEWCCIVSFDFPWRKLETVQYYFLFYGQDYFFSKFNYPLFSAGLNGVGGQ